MKNIYIISSKIKEIQKLRTKRELHLAKAKRRITDAQVKAEEKYRELVDSTLSDLTAAEESLLEGISDEDRRAVEAVIE